MKPRRILLAAFAVLAGLLAACGPIAEPASPASLTSPTPPAPGPTPTSALPAPSSTPSSMDTPPAPEGSAAVLNAVRQAAASEAALAAESITLHQIEHRDWPDASLGCPKRGVMYIQVITPGWRVVVEAGVRTLEYHTNESGSIVVLCAKS